MTEQNEQIDFEQVDADAVCENCGAVNPEGSVLCRACGNNLRDQRQRRIGQNPEAVVIGSEISRLRVFTGMLTVLGILIVLLAAFYMPEIEAWLVDIQSPGGSDAVLELWSPPGSEIYDGLLKELEESPTPSERIDATLRNPVDDDSYNGRYALVRHNEVLGLRILGEANLRRQGDSVYFVAKLKLKNIEIRGYAQLEGEEGVALRAVVWNSAGVRIDGVSYQAQGYTEKQEDGGHTCYGQSFFNDMAYFVSAYRIR